MAVCVLGKTDGSPLRYTFQPRSDIHAVTQQIAVALLDHITKMDADPELDAVLRRKPGVAPDQGPSGRFGERVAAHSRAESRHDLDQKGGSILSSERLREGRGRPASGSIRRHTAEASE